MPLRFLVPAFLLGLAALAIPVLVHLTRKQKARVVDFPSLMFLERVPFRAESRRRIHHWLLLLFRTLAVALVVAAFARPFLHREDLAAGTGAGPREVVILVDRSYSMGVGNRWEQALEAARAAVRELGPLDRASVVFFARSASVAVRSDTDQGRLLAALDTVGLSHESTAYGPGLKLAQTILEETELPGRALVLVGDFQRAGWTGDEGIRLPAGTEVTPVVLASEARPNRAVAGVSLSREKVAGRDRITPSARLTRTGGDGEEAAEIVLEVEGRELQRVPVTLPASGAASVTFEPFNLSRPHTGGAIRFADSDDLAPDDVHHFVLSPGRAIPVLVLDEGGRNAASSLFITEALAISEEGSFDVAVRAGGGITTSLLDGVSVVVVNDRPLGGGGAAGALRTYVEGGGGLLVVLGERIRWPQELADLLPGVVGGIVDRADASGARLGHLDYEHPVFEIFRGPRTGDFTRARFFRSRNLQVADSAAGRVLARFDDGSVALAEKQVGKGRVLAWTSTMDAFWNDLPRQAVFLPFLHQVVRYASGRTEHQAVFTAGQILDLSDAAAMATVGLGGAEGAPDVHQERVAVTPSGRSLVLASGQGPRFLHLEEPGVYEVRPAGSADERHMAVAVNVDLGEADLAPLDPEEVVASMLARSGEVPAQRGDGGARAGRLRLEDQERRQALWRVLLATAFVLLAAETLLSNRISRIPGRSGFHAGS